MKRISLVRIMLIGLVSLLISCSSPVAPVNMTAGGLAIKGYDPVAYFTDGRPVKGTPELQYEWHGAKWLFASQEHLRLFREAPERYAPQYGGYCAWAVARGKTADIDPSAWTIENGKLYLNLNAQIQKDWLREMQENIRKADNNWPKILKNKRP